MYTILLADDEASVLDSLISSIPWSQFGIDTILTAQDGVQALNQFAAQRIDLLITDIKMPGMDGMELLNRVRKCYPSTHCILLTAYGEFEYAREAVKLGVENYLLKPLQIAEIEETINKALDNIYTNRENSKLLFRNNILLRWVTGSISSEELSERAALLNINIYLSGYCVFCFKKRQKLVSLTAFVTQCRNRLSQMEGFSSLELHSFWDDKGRYVVIAGGRKIIAEDIITEFRNTAESLGIASCLALSAGQTVQESDAVAESYQTACGLIETADFSADDMVILTAAQFPEREDEYLIKELLSLYHETDTQVRSDGFGALADSLSAQSGKKETGAILSNTSAGLIHMLLLEFPNQPDIQEQLNHRIHLFSQMYSREDLAMAITELLEYGYVLFRYYFEQLSPVIQSALGYIHRHYADSLSIKEFCVKNKMSTAYLGYLFKKETGMFFNNYLTQYRICCSIELLRDTDTRISDIARQVGFSSTSYYISCFKKQTGLSPIKYRITQSEQEGSGN